MNHADLKKQYKQEARQLEVEMAKVEALNQGIRWILEGRKDGEKKK